MFCGTGAAHAARDVTPSIPSVTSPYARSEAFADPRQNHTIISLGCPECQPSFQLREINEDDGDVPTVHEKLQVAESQSLNRFESHGADITMYPNLLLHRCTPSNHAYLILAGRWPQPLPAAYASRTEGKSGVEATTSGRSQTLFDSKTMNYRDQTPPRHPSSPSPANAYSQQRPAFDQFQEGRTPNISFQNTERGDRKSTLDQQRQRTLPSAYKNQLSPTFVDSEEADHVDPAREASVREGRPKVVMTLVLAFDWLTMTPKMNFRPHICKNTKLWDLSSQLLLTTFCFPKPISSAAGISPHTYFLLPRRVAPYIKSTFSTSELKKHAGQMIEAIGGTGVSLIRVADEDSNSRKCLITVDQPITVLTISLTSSLLLVDTATGLVHFYDVASHRVLRTISAHKEMSISHLTTTLKPLDLVGHISLSFNLGSSADAKGIIPMRPVVPFHRMKYSKAREAHEVAMMFPVQEEASSTRIAKLEAEVENLRVQLGKAKGIDDVMWETIMQKVMVQENKRQRGRERKDEREDVGVWVGEGDGRSHDRHPSNHCEVLLRSYLGEQGIVSMSRSLDANTQDYAQNSDSGWLRGEEEMYSSLPLHSVCLLGQTCSSYTQNVTLGGLEGEERRLPGWYSGKNLKKVEELTSDTQTEHIDRIKNASHPAIFNFGRSSPLTVMISGAAMKPPEFHPV
ncbi:hypothetical protein EDD22DRAFT_995744 [Suillus occidentalis]|nr:hypothetical protein EDD22DRAFT_995744 [Suillus occidentalis]